MLISKDYLDEILEKTLLEYSEKIYPIENVKIKYVSKEEFLESAKNDDIIIKQIELGIYKDFDNEYPNFLVVYNYDKSPISLFFTGNYHISICFEIAKEKLKNFGINEVNNYLKHLFAHEITHILEETLKYKYPELWQKSLQVTGNDIGLAYELFAEQVASMISNEREYKDMLTKLWGFIEERMKKIK